MHRVLRLSLLRLMTTLVMIPTRRRNFAGLYVVWMTATMRHAPQLGVIWRIYLFGYDETGGMCVALRALYVVNVLICISLLQTL